MLESFFVIFRESVEAFLIVAIIASYLVKTERKYLFPSLALGVVFSMVLSGLLGNFLSEYDNMPLLEGLLGITAAILVSSLTVYVMKNAKKFSSDIKNKINYADAKSPYLKHILLFLFVVLMVAREGIEIAVMMAVISYDENATNMYLGSIFGVLATSALGFLWFKYSHLINLGKFLKFTSYFLILLAGHFFLYGFHELTEASSVPFVDNNYWHILTEDYAEGSYSDIITYAIVAMPFLYLIYSGITTPKNKMA
jgi:high-affinity iron transporter